MATFWWHFMTIIGIIYFTYTTSKIMWLFTDKNNRKKKNYKDCYNLSGLFLWLYLWHWSRRCGCRRCCMCTDQSPLAPRSRSLAGRCGCVCVLHPLLPHGLWSSWRHGWSPWQSNSGPDDPRDRAWTALLAFLQRPLRNTVGHGYISTAQWII